MSLRAQQTLQQPAELHGVGLFTNADVTVRLLPAAENHGLVFERTDLPGRPRIPATIEYLAPEHRRTRLANGTASIEMTEHLLAALAGLQIDNCLIQVNAPELPGCDGSALPYAAAILNGGIQPQSAEREICRVTLPHIEADESSVLSIVPYPQFRISYELNYGASSPIVRQSADFTLTPETFLSHIAAARTFVLEAEVETLRRHGYGARVTTADLLVFGADGPIENALRAPNECARHKLLDCLGDLALCGCDFQGHVRAFRSGHRQNHSLARRLFQALQTQKSESLSSRVAAAVEPSKVA